MSVPTLPRLPLLGDGPDRRGPGPQDYPESVESEEPRPAPAAARVPIPGDAEAERPPPRTGTVNAQTTLEELALARARRIAAV
jgi:hypothetical protein